MWNTEPDPIVMSVAIHNKPFVSTLIICYVPPFFKRSLTKNYTTFVSYFIISSNKYFVFASPISYIFLLVGGKDGFNGLSPVNTPIIIL